jgi:D-alanyl-D-alanine carboxypeptidase
MMLPSANDAAAAIADNYPGGRVGFVSQMNEKAKELHLTDTHFSDGIGLDDDENYSTVVDMERLSTIAMKNSTFAQVVGTHQKIIFNTNKTHQYVLSNLNKLLGFNGVNGIKTGTTEGAGEVLVTSAFIKGHTFIIVTMNSQDRFGDTATLLDYISNNLSYVNP